MITEQQKSRIKKIIPYALVAIVSIWIWYLTIPVLAMWLVATRKNLSLLKKILACVGITIVALVLGGQLLEKTAKTPVIAITEPQPDYTTGEKSVVIKGTVSPAESTVTIAGIQVPVQDGRFAYEAPLPNERNHVVVSAKNYEKESSLSITVNRTLTPEERAEWERQKAEKAARRAAADETKRKAEEERLAKERAEQKAQRTVEKRAYQEKLQSYYDRAMSYDSAGMSGYGNILVVMEGGDLLKSYHAVTLGETIMTNVQNNYTNLQREVSLANQDDEAKLKEALGGFAEAYNQRKHGMRNLLKYMDENKPKYFQDARYDFALGEGYSAPAKAKLDELKAAYGLAKWPPE